jgi:hypothetical protein
LGFWLLDLRLTLVKAANISESKMGWFWIWFFQRDCYTQHKIRPQKLNKIWRPSKLRRLRILKYLLVP